MKLEGIDHVALAVPDVAKTIEWYEEVLGFERRYDDVWGEVPTFIGLGTTALALFPLDETKQTVERGGPMLHLALRTDRAGFVRAKEELRKREIAFHFEDHTISHSIYFRDLNGLRLEITTYEL